MKFKRINQVDKVIALAYLFAALFTGLGYALVPIITNLYYVITFQPKLNFEMPVRAAFLYDVKKSPGYELSYLGLCCTAYLIIFINVSELLK